MAKTTDEINVVELLREKTEETDLKLSLKSTLGGFTKKSVVKYLTLLREQQQAAAEIFDQNMQSLFAEKANLKAENEALKERLLKQDSEYKNLSEAILVHDLENESYEQQEIVNFKGTIAAMENEIRKISEANTELTKSNEQLIESVKALETELALSRQETEAQKGQVALEKNESKKERDKILQLLEEVEEQRDEIKCLRELMSENKITQITNSISELKAQLNTSAEIIANYSVTILSKEQSIETLTAENESLKQNVSHLSKMLENTNIQNDKLLLANKSLSDQLKEEYKNAIAMINAKSDIIMDKLMAMKKLDEANSKIVMLEMQLERDCMSDEKKEILEKMSV